MKVVILGSGGGPQPSAERSSPSVAIVVGDRLYIVDCGSGVATQVVAAGLKFSQLRAVFLTHHHIDHNADYGNLIALGSTAGLAEPVATFGPPPLVALTDEFAHMSRIDASRRVKTGRPSLRSLFEPTEVVDDGVVWDDGCVRVTAARVVHPPLDAFGYRFDTDEGSVSISGDTSPCDAILRLAEGVDLLIHEAYSPDDLSLVTDQSGVRPERAQRHFTAGHTTAAEAGSIAERAGAKALVLWHLIPKEGISDESWVRQASSSFQGRLHVGRDLLTIEI